ncbi:MAG: hypothetical protein AAFY17_16230 [Cyanobacteria bacterium J06642_11]
MVVRLLLIASVLLWGCTTSSGPTSVKETSAARPELSDRIDFIEQYVTFDRSYNQLEYDITFQNNGGGLVPGPSDWDIKLLATVPENELAEWIPENATRVDDDPPEWVNAMAESVSVVGITEWYRAGGLEIGIDRSTSTIAYRNTTTPG